MARGEQDDDSDLDLIVDMDEDRSLFDLGGLAFDLEELLGCAVDVGLEINGSALWGIHGLDYAAMTLQRQKVPAAS